MMIYNPVTSEFKAFDITKKNKYVKCFVDGVAIVKEYVSTRSRMEYFFITEDYHTLSIQYLDEHEWHLFENINPFSFGYAVVKYGGKYGFIDKYGMWLNIGTKYLFEFAREFSEGFATIVHGDRIIIINQNRETIAIDNIKTVTPVISRFIHGCAIVDYGRSKGVIKTDGSWIMFKGNRLAFDSVNIPAKDIINVTIGNLRYVMNPYGIILYKEISRNQEINLKIIRQCKDINDNL